MEKSFLESIFYERNDWKYTKYKKYKKFLIVKNFFQFFRTYLPVPIIAKFFVL